MSHVTTVNGAEFNSVELLAQAVQMIGLTLEKDLSVRMYGSNRQTCAYGVKLDGSPYDLGFVIEEVETNGVKRKVLKPIADSELFVKSEKEYGYSKSKAAIDKIGFNCEKLMQAYMVSNAIQIAQAHNYGYNLNYINENQTYTLDVHVPDLF